MQLPRLNLLLHFMNAKESSGVPAHTLIYSTYGRERCRPICNSKKNLSSLSRPLPWTKSISMVLSSCSALGATTWELWTVLQAWLQTMIPRNCPFLNSHLSSNLGMTSFFIPASISSDGPGNSIGFSTSQLGSVSHFGSASQIGPGSDNVEDISSLSFGAAFPQEHREGSCVAVNPVHPLSALDFDLVLGQFGVVDSGNCGWITSGSAITFVLPDDRRFAFGSKPRTYSDGSVLARVLLQVVSKSPPDIRLGVIIESILDKLEALGMPSLLDLLITSVYKSDMSTMSLSADCFPSLSSLDAGRYSTS